MTIFTKADIEIETFHESTKKSAYVSKLYEYLDQLPPTKVGGLSLI